MLGIVSYSVLSEDPLHLEVSVLVDKKLEAAGVIKALTPTGLYFSQSNYCMHALYLSTIPSPLCSRSKGKVLRRPSVSRNLITSFF